MSDQAQLKVRLEPDELQRLKVLAATHGTTMSELVRDALRRTYLDEPPVRW